MVFSLGVSKRYALPLLVSTAFCSPALYAQVSQTPTVVSLPLFAPCQDADALMKQAAEYEAAKDYQKAGDTYTKAAKAYDAAGKNAKKAAAYGKAATMYEQQADALLGNTAPAAMPKLAGAPKPAPARQAATPKPARPATQPVRPFHNAPPTARAAANVARNKKGELAALNKGVALSRYNSDIQPPSVCVAPNGTIHVAFIEQRASAPFTVSVYHRASSDGGKTWSEAKNLSEVLPEYKVGVVKVAADSAGRVYVIFNTGLNEGFPTNADPHSINPSANLVYRVLSGGAWNSKAIPINKPGSPQKQDDGVASWFATTGTDGAVHVLYVVNRDYLHPELLGGTADSTYRPHDNGVGIGSVVESVLNGTAPSAPKEVFFEVKQINDNLGKWSVDTLDTINGYVDEQGAHFLAKVETPMNRYTDKGNRLELVENGTKTPVLNFPARPTPRGTIRRRF